jgi:hypothetical protein
MHAAILAVQYMVGAWSLLRALALRNNKRAGPQECQLATGLKRRLNLRARRKKAIGVAAATIKRMDILGKRVGV